MGTEPAFPRPSVEVILKATPCSIRCKPNVGFEVIAPVLVNEPGLRFVVQRMTVSAAGAVVPVKR